MDNPKNWIFFVEIPCSTIDPNSVTINEINNFKSIPLIDYLPSIKYSGEVKNIGKEELLEIDDDARRVCIFLKAFLDKISNERSYLDINTSETKTDDVIEYLENKYKDYFKNDDNCREVISTIFKKHMKNSELENSKKIHQKFFISYMKKRVDFLSNNIQFRTNNLGMGNPKVYKSWLKIGSILMEQMLHEVDSFSNRNIRCNWLEYPHIYLCYDDQSFKVLALDKSNPNCINLVKKLESLEVGLFKDAQFPMVPDKIQLKQKSSLLKYLSVAIHTPLKHVNTIINNSNYVLTLDYTLKMIQIHERQQNRMPTIIQGFFFLFFFF